MHFIGHWLQSHDIMDAIFYFLRTWPIYIELNLRSQSKFSLFASGSRNDFTFKSSFTSVFRTAPSQIFTNILKNYCRSLMEMEKWLLLLKPFIIQFWKFQVKSSFIIYFINPTLFPCVMWLQNDKSTKKMPRKEHLKKLCNMCLKVQ
jgi:hypothetical protein